MYLYFESPKFNLSHNIKPVIIEFWNRKLYFHLCFSSFSFGLFILFIYLFIYLSIYLFIYLYIYLFIYLFFRGETGGIVLVKMFPVILNYSKMGGNIDMVNKKSMAWNYDQNIKNTNFYCIYLSMIRSWCKFKRKLNKSMVYVFIGNLNFCKITKT